MPREILQQFINDFKECIKVKNTDFISKKCSYEKGLEMILDNKDYVCDLAHHHDFRIGQLKVEIKKSSGNFWIPEVRMAELFLNPDLLKQHYTLFIKTKKSKKGTHIENVAIVRTKYFLASLDFTEEYCQGLLERDKNLREKGRRLHSQQSYNWKDIIGLKNAMTF